MKKATANDNNANSVPPLPPLPPLNSVKTLKTKGKTCFSDGKSKKLRLNPQLSVKAASRALEHLARAAGHVANDNHRLSPGAWPGLWYVAQVAQGYDDMVAASMVVAGLEVWLPCYARNVSIPGTRSWRREDVRVAPGYVFVRMYDAANGWQGIMGLKGARGILAGSKGPLGLADCFIERWKIMLGGGEPHPAPVLSPGDLVRMQKGPYAAIEAVVASVSAARGRGKIEFQLFGRVMQVDVGLAQLEKCG